MDPQLFQPYWSGFTPERYAHYCASVDSATSYPTAFRLAECPVFLTEVLTRQLIEATEELCRQLRTPEFHTYSSAAIPAHLQVPHLNSHSQFLQLDFGICEEDGELVPKLIELQGFASMFCFQVLVDRGLRAHLPIPEGVSCYYSGLQEYSYLDLLRRCVLGGHDPKEVFLLEVHPDRQKTRIDFSATEALLGVKTVCITQVRREGRQLLAPVDGGWQPIRRLYNRVILDELIPLGLDLSWDLRDDVEVEWAAHPDWFMRISKHSLPFLKHESAPETYFAHEFIEQGMDPEGWVLKPLYSFAGSGVRVTFGREDLVSIEQPENWIVQRRVSYASCVPTPDGPVKAEVRMMVLWDDVPVVANTLVRLSRGATSNVAANTHDRFVGATTGYHRSG